MRTEIRTRATAVAAVAAMATGADVYFGVNPVGLVVGTTGRRGATSDVTRLAALVADFDVKPGGCPDRATAYALIDDIACLLGTQPVAITRSGSGLHAYWAVDSWSAATLSNAVAAALARRFGYLVAAVAARRDVRVDTISDLPRVLRVPGTCNHKNPDRPVPVVAVAGGGAPLAVDEIADRLDELNIAAPDAVGDEIISEPGRWAYGAMWCEYAKTATQAWTTDTPRNGRHPMLVSNLVRLACMWRAGCLPGEPELRAVIDAVARRHAELLTTTEPTRPVGRYEIEGAWAWAQDHVSRKTDEQVSAELGHHQHGDAPPDDQAPGQEAASENAPKGRVITWRTADKIRDGIPEWAWEFNGRGRLMRGTLNLFAGRPAAGKSTAARYFAAGYSQGILDGCFYGEPQNVAYIASEESIEYMIKPSLRAVGADMSRIYFPAVEMDGQQVRLLSILDEAALTEDLKAYNVAAVFVDPVMSSIGSTVDINRNNETRAYIEPWARIAAAINGLVTGVVHLTKAPGGDIVAAINGSSAFGEVARSIIAFAKDPQSEEGHRVCSQEKNSAGAEDLALTYAIETTTVETDEGPADVGRFVILGDSDRRVGDVLRAEATQKRLGEHASKVLDAARRALGSITPAFIAANVAEVSSDAAGKYLRRLHETGLLTKVSRGVYEYPRV